ncbi:hypothetical protein [Amphritea sp.]|uniref:hypothetical protein n=1 Tax=Amphritea sp. TaxID=1872502 RepID=UPI003A94FA8B
MGWNETDEYSAMIGGILYRNVHTPFLVNSKSLMQFSRNVDSGELGVSFELKDENGNVFSKVVNNTIEEVDDDFTVLEGQKRKSIIHKERGQVIFDLQYGIENNEFEIEISALFLVGGYPIILHPERTKLGCLNDNGAPNISRLTLSTVEKSAATGIGIDNGKIYLLGMCIENFRNGVDLKLGAKDGAA